MINRIRKKTITILLVLTLIGSNLFWLYQNTNNAVTIHYFGDTINDLKKDRAALGKLLFPQISQINYDEMMTLLEASNNRIVKSSHKGIRTLGTGRSIRFWFPNGKLTKVTTLDTREIFSAN